MQVRPFTDPLVHTDRFDGSLVPGLATSWEANDDGTQWTFHLRNDVEFTREWGLFTAHDVPHSVSLNTREDAIATDTGLFRELFGDTQEEQLNNVVALDDHTVRFNLVTPNSIMDFIASAQQGNLFIRQDQDERGGERFYLDGQDEPDGQDFLGGTFGRWPSSGQEGRRWLSCGKGCWPGDDWPNGLISKDMNDGDC